MSSTSGPRRVETHPAVRAVFEGGPAPTDPQLLATMTDDEQRQVRVFARLRSPRTSATPAKQKTYSR